MNNSAFRENHITISSGRFIALNKITFIDERGRHREWESADRVNTRGAVMIIGHLMPSNRILITRQFRPPAGQYILEFPAGLIDPDEAPEATAKRELMEETGYHGLLTFCSCPVYSSAGLSGETTNIAIIEINDYDFSSGAPAPHQEDSENIEIFAVETAKLHDFINQAIARGDGIDSKLLTFMMAQEFFHA